MRIALPQSRASTLVLATAALAVVGIADCTLMQMVGGRFDAAQTSRWALVTLVPLALAGAAAARVPLAAIPRGRRAPLAVACAAAVIAILVAADLFAFPPSSGDEWLIRARSKAPGVLAFLGLGLAIQLRPNRAARPWPASAADAAAIAGAQWVLAAGNYVEVHCPGARPRLVRATIGGIAATAEAAGLVRLHRSVLVRASAIMRWHNDRSGLVAAELGDGTRVPIGRNYRREAYRLRDACGSSPVS